MYSENKPERQIIIDSRTKLLQDRTKVLAEKLVEHQLKKDLIHFNTESIQSKEILLNEEKNSLDETKDKIYSLENDFCESVWKFSKEHDFGTFLNNYPRVKSLSSCNCEFYKEATRCIERDIQENAEIQKLTSEINALELEIKTLSNDRTLTEKIQKAFEELKLASQEDAEIIRLTKALQNSQHQLEFLQTEMEMYQYKDLLSKNLGTLKKTKKAPDVKKSLKKLKYVQKTPQLIESVPLFCPNTIDDYLIFNGNKATRTERNIHNPEDTKLMNQSLTLTQKENKDKSMTHNSWTLSSDNGFFFTDIESTMKEKSDFRKKEKTISLQKIFSKVELEPKLDDFGKSECLTAEPSVWERLKERKGKEQKSIPKKFTPKKQSAISEKLLKKH